MSDIKKLPHKKHYFNHLFRNMVAALLILVVSLLLGMGGYKYFYGISWVDSLLNASMILTGMGPVNTAPNDGAKIFASVYAIYSGVAFLTMVAVVFAPVLHRFLHRFHLDVEE
jgi:TRAP-type C4-dicarboxylate transport system permease small subunit